MRVVEAARRGVPGVAALEGTHLVTVDGPVKGVLLPVEAVFVLCVDRAGAVGESEVVAVVVCRTLVL